MAHREAFGSVSRAFTHAFAMAAPLAGGQGRSHLRTRAEPGQKPAASSFRYFPARANPGSGGRENFSRRLFDPARLSQRSSQAPIFREVYLPAYQRAQGRSASPQPERLNGYRLWRLTGNLIA